MDRPLLDGYREISLDIDKETLMSIFIKENREKEGWEYPMSLMKFTLSELMRKLNTSKDSGISTNPAEMRKRKDKYGINTLIPDYSTRHENNHEYSDVNLSKEKPLTIYIKEFFDDRMWSFLMISSIIFVLIAAIDDNEQLFDIKSANWVIGATLFGMILTKYSSENLVSIKIYLMLFDYFQ